jgi:predicted DNA-binding transcriptional regulator YafY
VWEQASLGPAAQRAVRKLETLGDGSVVDGPVGIETRIATAEPAFPVLLEALRARRRVRFDYRKPEDPAPETREVEPWGVASRRGHWYLIGRDTQRGAMRVFRLSRVAGAASLVGAAGVYDVPAGVDLGGAIASSPAGRVGALTARLRVVVDRGNGLRRRAISVDPAEGGDVVVLTYSDDEALAAEIVGHGAAVTVLEPASLRDAVVRRLRSAAGLSEVAS